MYCIATRQARETAHSMQGIGQEQAHNTTQHSTRQQAQSRGEQESERDSKQSNRERRTTIQPKGTATPKSQQRAITHSTAHTMRYTSRLELDTQREQSKTLKHV